MKTVNLRLNNQSGFTLVELMIVVAIIGVLSAVAVPNFKKYQAKAKTTEAKIQLAAAYTAEQAFYGDFGMYAHCLGYMGYDPHNENSARYYMIGFSETQVINASAHGSAISSGLFNASCPAAGAAKLALDADDADARNLRTIYPAGKGNGAEITDTIGEFQASALGNTATIGSQAGSATQIFLIGAAGVVSGDNTTTDSVSAFTIDQDKLMTVRNPGY